jgi:capsular polysaccharide biosynthesis protein
MLAKHQFGNVNPAGSLSADLFPARDRIADAPPGERVLPILWRRKLLLLLCTAVAVGTTMLYLRRATPLYSSTSRICIEQSVVPIMNSAFVAPLSPNFIATQAEVIKSTNVLELAETKLKALRAPGGAPRELKTFDGDGRFIGNLQSNLAVQLDPKVDIIDVSFTSPYPDEAAAVVNVVVDAYKDFHQRETHQDSAQVLTAAQAEKKKREAELADAVRKLNELRKDGIDLGAYPVANRGRRRRVPVRAEPPGHRGGETAGATPCRVAGECQQGDGGNGFSRRGPASIAAGRDPPPRAGRCGGQTGQGGGRRLRQRQQRRPHQRGGRGAPRTVAGAASQDPVAGAVGGAGPPHWGWNGRTSAFPAPRTRLPSCASRFSASCP